MFTDNRQNSLCWASSTGEKYWEPKWSLLWCGCPGTQCCLHGPPPLSLRPVKHVWFFPGVHNDLFGFVDLQNHIVPWAPLAPGDLLPVVGLFIVQYETYNCGIICKLTMMLEVWMGVRNVCEKHEKGQTEHIGPEGHCFQDEVRWCIVPYFYRLWSVGEKVLNQHTQCGRQTQVVWLTHN